MTIVVAKNVMTSLVLEILLLMTIIGNSQFVEFHNHAYRPGPAKTDFPNFSYLTLHEIATVPDYCGDISHRPIKPTKPLYYKWIR